MISLLRKQWRLTLAHIEDYLGAGFFALLLVAAVSIFTEALAPINHQWVAGLYWIILSFAITMICERSFVRESQNDWIGSYLLAGLSSETIFLVKLIHNLILGALLGTVLWLLMGFFMNFSLIDKLPQLLTILFLSLLCWVSLGCFFAAMLRPLANKPWLLSILYYPLLLPVLLTSIQLSADVLDLSTNSLGGGLRLLTSMALIYLALSFMLVERLLEER